MGIMKRETFWVVGFGFILKTIKVLLFKILYFFYIFEYFIEIDFLEWGFCYLGIMEAVID